MLRDEGLDAPLPIATNTTAEYAERRRRGADVDDAFDDAQKGWSSDYGDSRDRHISYLYGAAPSIDVLGDRKTFDHYAARLWAPLFAAETQVQP